MNQFGPLLSKLLQGQFICELSEPEWFRQLQQEDNRQAIDQYLKPLNRRLSHDQQQRVYFLAFDTLDQEAREQLSQQFKDSLASLLPVLEWLQLVQESQGLDSILSPGDTLNLHDFVARCEDHQGLRQRLQQLANDRFFNSQSDDANSQAKQIFKRLREHGYLMQPHSTRSFFIVGGKIDYLMEVLAFIRDEERLPIETQVAEQQELL